MDERICPICGLKNECMVDAPAGSCWCMTVEVPRTLLAQLADSDKNARCICRNCIEQHQK